MIFLQRCPKFEDMPLDVSFKPQNTSLQTDDIIKTIAADHAAVGYKIVYGIHCIK